MTHDHFHVPQSLTFGHPLGQTIKKLLSQDKAHTHTFLPLTGGGIIVRALNLLFLQVGFKPSQVCVETPDVFVNLQTKELQQTDTGPYFMKNEACVFLISPCVLSDNWHINNDM